MICQMVILIHWKFLSQKIAAIALPLYIKNGVPNCKQSRVHRHQNLIRPLMISGERKSLILQAALLLMALYKLYSETLLALAITFLLIMLASQQKLYHLN